MEKLLNLILLPKDKANHALYGLLLYSLLALVIQPTVAILFVIAVAVSKEVYDWFKPKLHTSDIMDLVYTIAPALAIYLIGLLA